MNRVTDIFSNQTSGISTTMTATMAKRMRGYKEGGKWTESKKQRCMRERRRTESPRTEDEAIYTKAT